MGSPNGRKAKSKKDGHKYGNTNYPSVFKKDIAPYNVLEFPCVPRATGTIHESQKPVATLRYLIRIYSNEGDLILDNTMGSGSTGEAALRENRRFIGMELYPLSDKPLGDDNPDYFGIAQKRLDNVARELRGEWKPLQDKGDSLEGLPMFEGVG